MDLPYCYYCIQKTLKILSLISEQEGEDTVLDESILLINNLAFLYSKIGAPQKAISNLEQIILIIKKYGDNMNKKAKGTATRPDFFTFRCKKIKYQKIKARTNLSLCVLHSEQLLHDKALEYARKALSQIVGLIYDSYMFCYHLILRADKKTTESSKVTNSLII